MCAVLSADSNVSLLQLFLQVVGAPTVRSQMSVNVLSAVESRHWWSELLPLMSSVALRLVYPFSYVHITSHHPGCTSAVLLSASLSVVRVVGWWSA